MISAYIKSVITVPDITDLENQFQPNTNQKNEIFKILTEPSIMLRIITATYYTPEYSPIFLVVDPVLELAIKQGTITKLSDSDKKFVGGVVLSIMTSNGYKKNGDKKQKKGKNIFSTGQTYIR